MLVHNVLGTCLCCRWHVSDFVEPRLKYQNYCCHHCCNIHLWKKYSVNIAQASDKTDELSEWTEKVIRLEMLKSNFLDNRLPKRKNRFLFDYRFSHCTIPPHCDSHLNAASFDPLWMHGETDLPPSPRVHFPTLHRPPLFASAGTFPA